MADPVNVWGICACKDEADIIDDVLRHTLDQNVDGILISDGMSTDGTRDIIERLGYDTGAIVMLDRPDPDGVFRQAETMNALAGFAAEPGDWIVPFDADEYWSSTTGAPLADVLRDLPDYVVASFGQMFDYVDRDRRLAEPKPLPKVAYRWNPAAVLSMGQHGVSGCLGPITRDAHVVREIQFRSLEHFKSKVRQRLESLEPGLPPGTAQHYVELAHFTEEQLDARWAELAARPTVFDPIPRRDT